MLLNIKEGKECDKVKEKERTENESLNAKRKETRREKQL